MILTQKPNQSDKQIYNIIMYNHNKTAIGTNIIILNDLSTNDWYIYTVILQLRCTGGEVNILSL